MKGKIFFKPSKKLIRSIKIADLEYKNNNMKKYKSARELFEALSI